MKKIVLISALSIGLQFSVQAQDTGNGYTFYGRVGLFGLYNYCLNADQELSSDIELELNHTFEFRSGEIFIHHKLILNHAGDFSHTLYEAYLFIMPWESLSLTLGKKYLSLGTGYLYSPSDAINTGNGIWDQEMGANGIILTFTPVHFFSLTFMVETEKAMDKINFGDNFYYGLFLTLFIEPVELKISTVYAWEKALRPALGLSIDLAGFIFNAEGAVEFINSRTYPEGDFSIQEKSAPGRPFLLLDFGIQKTIMLNDYSIGFVLEYFYLATGYNKEQSDLLFAAADSGLLENTGSVSAQQLLNRHYLFTNLSFMITDLLNFETGLLLNLEDFSFLMHHLISYLYSQQLDFNIEITWTYGKKNHSEFGLHPSRLSISAGVNLNF